MEHQKISTRSRPFATILEYKPRSDLLYVLQTSSEIKSDTNDQQDNSDKMPLFAFAKCNAASANREAILPVTTSSSVLIYMAPHLSCICNQTGLSASGTGNALLHVPITVQVAKISKSRQHWQKEFQLKSESTYQTSSTIRLKPHSFLREQRGGRRNIYRSCTVLNEGAAK